jgi:hypothetical protein
MTLPPSWLHAGDAALIIELAARRRGREAVTPSGHETLIPVPLALSAEQLELLDAVGQLALKLGVAMTSRTEIITMLIDLGVAVLLTDMGATPPENPPPGRRGPAVVIPIGRRERDA